MAKYSRIYKVGKKSFRYDNENATLQWVYKPDKQIIEDNKEWQAKHGKDLWDIVDGYVICDIIGLGRENWAENPKYWCEQYAHEIGIECSFM